LAPAAIFSENLVKPLMKGKLSDAQLLKVTRISILVFSVIATVMACVRTNIYELVGESSVLSLVSLFAPLAFGLYWKRASAIGALLSMVTGMLTWIIFEVLKTSWPSLIPALIVSLLAMVVGSLVWPSKQNE
jgi:Na+/proline symporter